MQIVMLLMKNFPRNFFQKTVSDGGKMFHDEEEFLLQNVIEELIATSTAKHSVYFTRIFSTYVDYCDICDQKIGPPDEGNMQWFKSGINEEPGWHLECWKCRGKRRGLE